MNTTQSALRNTDTKAWYQQFWPWFLIALLASAMAMGFIFLYFAINGADPVIDDNYYQHGLDINKTLEQNHTPQQRR
jgi:hypothetical protein